MSTTAGSDIDVEAVIDHIGHGLVTAGLEQSRALLAASDYRLDYWNHDQFTGDEYKLLLQVPRSAFPANDSVCQEMEDTILDLANEAFRAYEDSSIAQVKIIPKLQRDSSWRGGVEQPLLVPSDATQRLWKPGFFRLFITHKDEQKADLDKMRPILHFYGIDIFVAHVEIEPDEYWQAEIRYGLQSCDSLFVFHGPGVSNSVWCQQEIGWAMGRGIYVHSIKCGETPVGLHAERQASPIDITDPYTTAKHVADRLHGQARLQAKLYDGFAARFATAESPQAAYYSWSSFEEYANCPDTHIHKIVSAFESNPRAMESYKAVPAVKKWKELHLKGAGQELAVSAIASTAIEEEYDPFADE